MGAVTCIQGVGVGAEQPHDGAGDYALAGHVVGQLQRRHFQLQIKVCRQPRGVIGFRRAISGEYVKHHRNEDECVQCLNVQIANGMPLRVQTHDLL